MKTKELIKSFEQMILTLQSNITTLERVTSDNVTVLQWVNNGTHQIELNSIDLSVFVDVEGEEVEINLQGV